jgi:hypothetical protein
MTTNGESKFSHLVIGLGLGTVSAVISAVLTLKKTREFQRKRSGKGPTYLNQQAGKLRETADALERQEKKLIAAGSVKNDTEAERQAYETENRQNLRG